MQVYGRDLAVGDVIRIHDWVLHVVGVDRDVATAVRTAELNFLLHFLPNETVEVLWERRRGFQVSPRGQEKTSASPGCETRS